MKKIILVVDDDIIIQKTMKRILSNSGYNVIISSNGIDALDQLTRVQVDLIMLDQNMPQMNGLQFLQKYKTEINRNIPILMMSGSTDSELRLKCYRHGVYDFISKPEHVEVMLKRIENGLKIGEMIHFNDQMKVELMMAKRLQKYLYPEIQVKMDTYDFYTFFKPLSDIGGDLYDIIQFQDNGILFFVADVSGHSISAALYTSMVKMIFQNSLKEAKEPGGILTYMNRELYGNISKESFVTIFCGLYNPQTHILQYSNAGHPQPLCTIDGDICELEGGGPFLGPIEGTCYDTYEQKFSVSDIVMIYTDGLLDIFNKKNNELVGKNKIYESVGDSSLSFHEKCDAISKLANNTEMKVIDDCTLIAIGIK